MPSGTPPILLDAEADLKKVQLFSKATIYPDENFPAKPAVFHFFNVKNEKKNRCSIWRLIEYYAREASNPLSDVLYPVNPITKQRPRPIAEFIHESVLSMYVKFPKAEGWQLVSNRQYFFPGYDGTDTCTIDLKVKINLPGLSVELPRLYSMLEMQKENCDNELYDPIDIFSSDPVGIPDAQKQEVATPQDIAAKRFEEVRHQFSNAQNLEGFCFIYSRNLPPKSRKSWRTRSRFYPAHEPRFGRTHFTDKATLVTMKQAELCGHVVARLFFNDFRDNGDARGRLVRFFLGESSTDLQRQRQHFWPDGSTTYFQNFWPPLFRRIIEGKAAQDYRRCNKLEDGCQCECIRYKSDSIDEGDAVEVSVRCKLPQDGVKGFDALHDGSQADKKRVVERMFFYISNDVFVRVLGHLFLWIMLLKKKKWFGYYGCSVFADDVADFQKRVMFLWDVIHYRVNALRLNDVETFFDSMLNSITEFEEKDYNNQGRLCLGALFETTMRKILEIKTISHEEICGVFKKHLYDFYYTVHFEDIIDEIVEDSPMLLNCNRESKIIYSYAPMYYPGTKDIINRQGTDEFKQHEGVRYDLKETMHHEARCPPYEKMFTDEYFTVLRGKISKEELEAVRLELVGYLRGICEKAEISLKQRMLQNHLTWIADVKCRDNLRFYPTYER